MKRKKITALFVTCIMLLGAVGCGKTDSPDTATSGDAEAVVYPTESSLKGTGPATAEDLASSSDANESAQLKDGDVLVDINFDDGSDNNFVTYTNGGSFELKNEEGQLVADIKNCGGLDYANQAYWDGFALSKNCVYTYSFDVSCDIERKFEYRLQINGGDYHAYQGEVIDIGPEVTNFTVDFEMTEESDPAPRIVFNMGKMEDMSSDPGEHKIYIDNIKLEVKDASNAMEVSALPNYVNVGVDQMGYKPDDSKIAVVKTDSTDDEEFIVCDANTNETVYAGKLGDPIYDYGAELNVRRADFSEFKTEGEYYVYTNEGASYKFVINSNPYKDIYTDTVLMLYKQRCGVEVENSDAFNHPACHTDQAAVYGDESKKMDVSGGWHDAGDYGRYTVSTAKTIADLLLSYEDFGVEDDQMGIPESGNGIPDILDEARVGLDWMLKMQDPETGGVYHKVTCAVFPETVPPQEETDELLLAPISVAATGDFAAILAKASVTYKEIDSDFSKIALEAAEKAWDYLESLDTYKGYTNPSDIVTGEYGDGNVLDERYWAAVELYLAGSDKTKDF
nr:glycoside hydrolase family 9 protein [Eubacterium sp.]